MVSFWEHLIVNKNEYLAKLMDRHATPCLKRYVKTGIQFSVIWEKKSKIKLCYKRDDGTSHFTSFGHEMQICTFAVMAHYGVLKASSAS